MTAAHVAPLRIYLEASKSLRYLDGKRRFVDALKEDLYNQFALSNRIAQAGQE